MHGAIAYTDEHDSGLYLHHAMTLAALLGNSSVHRKRYLALTQARAA
jgi:alkylation response protein AidB-like acyl-CoA dehydrogenase